MFVSDMANFIDLSSWHSFHFQKIEQEEKNIYQYIIIFIQAFGNTMR